MKAFDTNPGETLSGQIRLPEGVETVRRQITLGRERVCVGGGAGGESGGRWQDPKGLDTVGPILKTYGKENRELARFSL